MTLVGITTITGGIMNMINIYIPQISAADTKIQGTINTLLTTLILICVLTIIIEATHKWFKGDKKVVMRE